MVARRRGAAPRLRGSDGPPPATCRPTKALGRPSVALALASRGRRGRAGRPTGSSTSSATTRARRRSTRPRPRGGVRCGHGLRRRPRPPAAARRSSCPTSTGPTTSCSSSSTRCSSGWRPAVRADRAPPARASSSAGAPQPGRHNAVVLHLDPLDGRGRRRAAPRRCSATTLDRRRRATRCSTAAAATRSSSRSWPRWWPSVGAVGRAARHAAGPGGGSPRRLDPGRAEHARERRRARAVGFVEGAGGVRPRSCGQIAAGASAGALWPTRAARRRWRPVGVPLRLRPRGRLPDPHQGGPGPAPRRRGRAIVQAPATRLRRAVAHHYATAARLVQDLAGCQACPPTSTTVRCAG